MKKSHSPSDVITLKTRLLALSECVPQFHLVCHFNENMEPSFNSVEFYKYRRKISFAFKFILALFILLHKSTLNAEEVYQCNNQTQTCISEHQSEHGELNDQQLFQLPTALSSWAELPQCRGKILLSQLNGFISDGPGNYSLDTKCTWVVQSSQPNSTIM